MSPAIYDSEAEVEALMPTARALAWEKAAKLPRLRDELESAAMLGLAEAAHRYDPFQGVKFSTYAHARIRGAILDALRAEWPRGYGRGHVGDRPDVVSLASTAEDRSGVVHTIGDRLPDPRAADPGRPETEVVFASALRGLPGPERAMVTLVYRDGLEQAEAAGRVGVALHQGLYLLISAKRFLRRDPRARRRLEGESFPEPAAFSRIGGAS